MKPLRSECFASMWGFPAKENSELLAMVSNSICPLVSPALSRPVNIQGALFCFSQEQASEGDGTSQEVTTEECSIARSENRNHLKVQEA